VAAHIKKLATSLLEGARSLHIQVKTPADSVGPLLVLRAKNADALVQKFAEHDVVISNRHDGLRVSFHAYNTPEDVDCVLRMLENSLDLLVTN
jgi:selenocysteine lyase/cysteine desulfurase